jgi:hypothetical protein
MNQLEERVDFLISNNLQWKIPKHLPVNITEEKDFLATIHFYPKNNRPTFFIEVLPDKEISYRRKFQSMSPASEINVSPRIFHLSDKAIDCVLLHELCHWYTEETYYPIKTQGHGAEFKKSARKLKLPAGYARATATHIIYEDAKDVDKFFEKRSKALAKSR